MEQLVEPQKIEAKFIIMRNWVDIGAGNALKGKAWREPHGHYGNLELISEAYE